MLLRDHHASALSFRRTDACRRDHRFWYRSSLVLFWRRQPIPLKFGEVRQCLEVGHPVEIDMSHQVIEFVLDDARKKAIRRNLDLSSLPVQRIDTKFAPARDTATKIRNTEA